MKVVTKMALLAMLAVVLVFSAAYAGDMVAKGKKHFENPSFADGKKACNACHPGGRGLEAAGSKTKFNIMGGTQNSLEEAVNFCIVNANKGKAISEDSAEMNEIVAYIKSLGSQAAPGYGAPGYKAPGYGAPGYKAPGYKTK